MLAVVKDGPHHPPIFLREIGHPYLDFEITWHGAARPDRERHHPTCWQECRAVQQPRWRRAAEKRARRYTFDRHAVPSRGRTHAPATDVLRIAAAPTAT